MGPTAPWPGLELRAAVEADLEELVDLAVSFYAESGFATGSDALRRHFVALLAAPNARIAVAVDGERPFAFALTTTALVLESGVVAELQDLYVRPERRRRGVAGALVDDAAAWARTRAASLLEVVVAPNGRDVSHLVAYYTARGFVDEERSIFGLRL